MVFSYARGERYRVSENRGLQPRRHEVVVPIPGEGREVPPCPEACLDAYLLAARVGDDKKAQLL